MKQKDLKDINYNLSPQQYENIFNVYEDDKIGYYYNLLRTVNFPEDIDPDTYTEYVIEYNDTWPLIAWKHYNNIVLWWVLCSLNNVQDPLKELVPGERIKVLKIIYLKSILNDINLH